MTKKKDEVGDVSDWTFEELVSNCAWQVTEGLLRGDKLRNIVWRICDWSARWNAGQKKVKQ